MPNYSLSFFMNVYTSEIIHYEGSWSLRYQKMLLAFYYYTTNIKMYIQIPISNLKIYQIRRFVKLLTN